MDTNQILLNEGIPGVEAHCKKQLADNDKKWFKLFLFMCLLFIGFWCIKTEDKEPIQKEAPIVSQGWIDSAKAQNFKDQQWLDSVKQYN